MPGRADSRSARSRAWTSARSSPPSARPSSTARDASSRVLRYSSDGCVLFVYVNGTQAQYADAYDPQMRPIPTDQCAGSVAAQKRNA